MKQKISVTASTFGTDPRRAIESARRAGFAGVLLDSGFDVTTLSGTGRREFRQILATFEQTPVGLDVQLGPVGIGPGADVDHILSRLSRLFDAAAGLGSPLVCLDVGRLPEPAKAVRPRSAVTPQQAGRLILPAFAPPVVEAVSAPADPAFVSAVDQAASAVGELADQYSVAVAVRTGLSSFAAVGRMLASVRCPWFGVDLDPTSVLRDDWSMDEIFSTLGDSILHVRGKDALLGTDRRTQPAAVGGGSVDWSEFQTDLDGAGYGGWISVDPGDLGDRGRAAAAGLARLVEP